MKCDITALKTNVTNGIDFPAWSSQGESLLDQFGCDMITVPSKSGVLEYLIGNKRNSSTFEAIGAIKSSTNYDDNKNTWNAVSFKKKKIVISGIHGSRAVIPLPDIGKITKSLKNIVDEE